MPKKRFGKAKMKNMWCSFRPWFSSGLWHFVLINKNWKMYETAIPMGKMLNAFLAIHGRCKFIIFLRGQTPSLSAPTLILSLMEHFEGKAKNTVKYSVKSTFCRSIQINCNWLPGNPQPSPYIYICTCMCYTYADNEWQSVWPFFEWHFAEFATSPDPASGPW